MSFAALISSKIKCWKNSLSGKRNLYVVRAAHSFLQSACFLLISWALVSYILASFLSVSAKYEMSCDYPLKQDSLTLEKVHFFFGGCLDLIVVRHNGHDGHVLKQ